ncbi:MAG TPA: MBL fold metallo-hydrolase, partial [Polyangiaceae bacterium]|nr:MBL fold metallo-hydrolase [Polyangiaceae bacterium]
MLTTVKAGPYTVRGVSVGGVHTALCVPELRVLFDVGIAARSFVDLDTIFLSHAHADHIGALVALLGIRGLSKKPPPKVFLPAEVASDVQEALRVMTKLQRYDLSIEAIGMKPKEELQLRKDLFVRAFRTFHPVPSLGYALVRRTQKLRPQFLSLSSLEIQERRRAGEDLFYEAESIDLAYATDTLVKVLDQHPFLYNARVLILECSFLNEKKSLQASQAGCHIHLDELLERAEHFQNEALVLMHFSQLYSPREVHEILAARCPPRL